MTLLQRLGLSVPLVQAPMAGVSTPSMAAAVSNAGALGSIGVGATDPTDARRMIEEVRARTERPFNVNLFVHTTPQSQSARELAWIEALAPLFAEFGAKPPSALRLIYKSFVDDDDMIAMLVDLAPTVVSFHFGVPKEDRIAALKRAGCLLFATATSLAEAEVVERAGCDAIVAQGFEAGGHRGIFDPDAVDDQLGTLALTRLLASRSHLPIIAAGGIMDGRSIRAALELGAVAAQLGTAFVGCPESAADEAYRVALVSSANEHTVMTNVISGRPARCLRNRFTDWGSRVVSAPPDYPIAYDAGKALNAAAKASGEGGFAAQWAGQGAPLSRQMPAADLVTLLNRELMQTFDLWSTDG